MSQSPYRMSFEEILKAYQTDRTKGITSQEAKKRLAEDGPNAIREAPGPTIWAMLWRQLTEPLVLVLIVAALISGAVGELTDAAVIMLIVVLNAGLGIWQERKAERSLAALRELGAPLARVIRDGEAQNIPAPELVRGDVVLIEEGDFIPADGRLIDAVNLSIDESALTGESVPVEKDADPLANEDVAIGDRTNMVHKSTVVTYGRGTVVITGTGMNTEIGKIADLIQQAPDVETPLQRRLASLGKGLGLLALGLVVVIFIAGVLRGIEFFEMFMTSVSLAVAAIPEGLPTIVTIVLALGVQRMSQHRAIIRKLPAVESLGSATYICSDKTGTLTQNKMTIQRIYAGGEVREAGAELDTVAKWLVMGGTLNSNASVTQKDGQTQVVGDPTEGALVMLGSDHHFTRESLQDTLPRIAEAPFDSVRKRMTTLHRAQRVEGDPDWLADRVKEGAYITFTKGAPDLMVARTNQMMTNDGIVPLTDADRDAILGANEKMAEDALRVLAVGMRIYDSEPTKQPEELANLAESEMIFLGLVGMIDPPRPEAREAIATCRKAGIHVVMITGDHLITAKAIGRDLELFTETSEALTGKDLDEMDDATLEKRVKNVSVFARVSPEHKVRIVNALQANGELVAMTGDGVNDAPALRRADIGAAMGIAGTDVAKEAADMVLTDDNFATIVSAVSEGRTIFTNIKKSIRYLLSCNAGELAAIFLAIMFGWPRPLIAVQILWVNLVTDGFPALALGVEPSEPGAMDRPPRDPKGFLFTRREMRSIVLGGLWIATITLIAFWIGWRNTGDEVEGRTMAFATLAFSQLFQALNNRSEHVPLAKLGFFSNKAMNWAILASALLQIVVLTVPFLQGIFGTQAITGVEWLVVLGLSASILIFGEIRKALEGHGGSEHE